MSSNTLCCLSLSLFSTALNLFENLHTWPRKNHMQKWGVVTVNHMNYDVVEVNGPDPRMLPGSFLYEKEPGYEANRALY